ncbi:mucin-17 [Zerene cesonia]|uniref:mucin-17 n=1 Tax=Zerene cesonia TaxID=33412 RepID=UPI0018E5034C|nr:mucin-17 [Zerene cesonia]
MGNFDRRPSPSKMGNTTWLALIAAIFAFVTPALSSSPRVVCYYTNWSVYRPGTAKFNPQNINPYLCTHLVYAFGGFTKDNTLKPFDKYQDIEKGGYAKFTGLKTYNKNLKTILAIGGWNEGSSRFSPMVASKDRRKEFVRNVIKFLRQNHFDGLDLDWEYPAFRDGGKAKDRENYAKLVKELREEFERESEKTGKPRLLLTMAVPAGIEYIEKGFDVRTLNKYLDWMNLLTYDYHSAFEPAVNHHAPLYPLEEPNEYSVDNELNIDYTIKFYLENGADRDKLVLGIPTYGRSYTLFNPDAVEIGSPADGPGEQGEATREKGYLAFYEICEALKAKSKKRAIDSDEDSEDSDEEEEDEEWTVMYPNKDAMGPVAYKGNQWVGYDDIDIVKKKGEYVAENGLGGIMFWSIDNDDFRGACYGKPYPLIEAAKESYIAKLGSTQNTVTESSRPSSSGSRRRSKPRSTTTTPKPSSKSRPKTSVQTSTPAWNIITPEPPTTPDPGSDFKCTDEGFFPHPRDCKKYFWCLDSGPSDLGIVAHQFTCPSGLYFNKAADSCDFARNVLCKKPAATTKAPTKATTTTTTTVTTTTTTRRPVRLTSKSSLLFRTSTTTPEPELSEEEEEFSDEEADDAADVEAEDPKVIKELIDLIKKVGGVEQLEKHLHLAESGASAGELVTTTPSNFNKKLYQKVLERARGQSKYNSNTIPTSGVQNSRRGPQNAGLQPSPDNDKTYRKERPQYVTINRSRQSTTPEPLESLEQNESGSDEVQDTPTSSETSSRGRESINISRGTSRPLQYVNIRRNRPTTESDDIPSRNALFDRAPLVAVEEAAGSVDISSRRETTPEYVTIRRTRPTTEETSTVPYQQSDEEESQESILEREITSPSPQPQYSSIIRTRSTTLSPPEEINTPEPTTILSVQISSLLNAPNPTETEETVQTTEAEVTSTTQPTTTTTTTSPTTAAPTTRRNALRRRGSTTPTTTAPTTTQVSSRNYSFIRRRRPLSQPNDISDSQEVNEISRKIRSTTPDSRETENKPSPRNVQIRRFRSRFQTTSSDDSVPAAAAQVPRGEFRPQLTRDEVLSLTPIDVDEKQILENDEDSEEDVSPRSRVATTIADKAEDSEFSAATIDERRPSIITRGRGRFVITTESLKQSVTESPQRRPTLARFTPRPFGRAVTNAPSTENPNDLNNAQTERSRNRARLPFTRPRIGAPSNSPVLQARKLPFPSRVSSTPIPSPDKNEDELENQDDIALSESAIEEKEHDEEYDEPIETTKAPIRQRVTIKKFQNPDSGLINESVVDETGKRKFRVIRRRPTTTTKIETTEPATTPPTRRRKIIRKKIKPIEEDEIIPTNVPVINAGFRDVPPEVLNYGERTKSTTATLPETTTENEDSITDTIITAFKNNFDLVKIKTNDGGKNQNEEDKDSTNIENNEGEAEDEDTNTELNNENLQENNDSDDKPNITVAEEDKTINLSDLNINNNISSALIKKDDDSAKETTTPTERTEAVEIITEPVPVSPEIKEDSEDLTKNNNNENVSDLSNTGNDTLINNTMNESNQNQTSVSESDVVTETTVSTTQQLTSPTARSRLPYRPSKRLFTSTTESSVPSSSRTFSRKYNPGAYTSPSTVERPNSFRRPTTKRPLFSRTFTRRTFPTARTTPRYQQEEEEEEEYSDEELLEEEPENPLVFVPPSKLFTRKPDSEEYEDNEDEDLALEDEEEAEDENYEDEPQVNRFVPSTRKPFFKPRIVNSNTFRTSTSTTELPKPLIVNQNKTGSVSRIANKPIDLTKKRVQNVPIGYNAPNANKTQGLNITKSTPSGKETSPTTTASPEPESNPTTTENDDYLTMDDITTTSSDLNNTKVESDSTTNTLEFETVTSEMEIDNSTDDYLEYTTNYPSTQEYPVYTQTEVDVDKATSVDTLVTDKQDINQITTTENSAEGTTNIPQVSPIIKTQFDKLFSISRVVEVSSKSEKHRLNKNNETTLIEEGQVVVEKKPTVDKIGEVSRYSLIKIFEDEIPIYLTKLGHVYPVDNPPNNPIRIDEARNARALFDYSDAPKENLVASESMNEAYRHVNKISKNIKGVEQSVGKGHVEHINDDDFLSFINDDDKKSDKFDEDRSYSNWQFIPAAYENEQNRLNKPAKIFDVVTPRAILTDPSTLSLEALFKTETPIIARKMNDANSNHPFVVYSASVPTQKEDANIVKLEVLKPETGRSIVTFAKGQEFKGSTVSEDSTIKYPINISVIPQTTETPITSTQSTSTVASSTTSTTTEAPTSPIIELLTTVQTTVPVELSAVSESITTQTTPITDAPTTETVTEEITTVKLSPLEAKRSKYFPRRPIKPLNSNATRYNPVQRPLKKNNTTFTTTTKAPFSPSKSRFSANRAQNVPVDLRKKSTTKSSRTFSTESPRTTTERRAFIKPIRPSRPAFVPRRLTTPSTNSDS